MARNGKILLAFLILLFMPALSSAQTITFNDPFPGTGGDVIGDLSKFDIEQATLNLDLSANTMDIGLYFNYKNSAITVNTINTYNIFGLELDSGDILFGEGGFWKYGIALSSRTGSPNGGPYSSGGVITKGGFYEIVDQRGVLTAHDVLQNDSLAYRKNESVWLYENSGPDKYLSYVDSATSFTINPSPTAAEYLLSLTLPINQEFETYMASGLDFRYTVATCGNDIIDGTVQTPEPLTASMLFFAGGFLSLIGLGRNKD